MRGELTVISCPPDLKDTSNYDIYYLILYIQFWTNSLPFHSALFYTNLAVFIYDRYFQLCLMLVPTIKSFLKTIFLLSLCCLLYVQCFLFFI